MKFESKFSLVVCLPRDFIMIVNSIQTPFHLLPNQFVLATLVNWSVILKFCRVLDPYLLDSIHSYPLLYAYWPKSVPAGVKHTVELINA